MHHVTQPVVINAKPELAQIVTLIDRDNRYVGGDVARYNVSTDLVAHTKRSLEINEVAGLNAANICGVEGFADHIKPNGVAVDSSGGKASTVYRDRGS